jgi:parallel beta-helix repeat protein
MTARHPLVHDTTGALAELPAGDWLTSPGGVIDCSAMTTAAEVNAAANPATAGPNATIWLGPRDTPLDVTEPLIVHGGQTWLGAGGRELHTTVRAAVGLGAGLPIMCSEGWFNDADDADEPIIVRGIRFDLNGLTDRCGLIVYNFWSWVDDCQFSDADGDCANLLVTDSSRDGSASANSHSENRFTALRFDGSFNGARHLYSVTTNGLSNQDGHLADSFFAGSDGPAIHITRAAGWTVENNHLYGCGDNAIYLQNCYATKVINNYIEDFGRNNVTTGPTNGYYSAIGASILDGKPSIIALNTVSLVEPDDPVAWNRATCIGVRAGTGQLDARITLVGNTIAADGATGVVTNSEAFRIGEGGDTGRLLSVTWAGNQITPRAQFASVIFRSNSTTRIVRDPPWVRSYSGVIGAITLDAGFESLQNFTCVGDVTVSPPTTLVVDRDVLRLAFLAFGGDSDIEFASSILTSTGLGLSYTVPAGEVLLAAVEYSVLVGAWVLTAATVSAT